MNIKDVLKRTFLRKRTLLLLLFAVGYIFLRVAKSSTYFAEMIFARHIFRAMSQGMALITGIFPFSLAEIMIILCPALVIALIAGFIVKLVKNRKDWLHWVLTFFLNAAVMASVVYFFYSFGCGINYYRYPLGTYLGLEIEPSSKEELKGLVTELADTASKLRSEISSVDEKGNYKLSGSARDLGKKAKEAYKVLGREYSLFGGIYPAPKCVLLSRLMSYTEITGIYTCWTMEANVDIDIPDYSIGSTMCHELAHLRGFIREDEANYISYLACMASPDKELQYSGVMYALVYAGNALASADGDMYAEVWYGHYSEEVRADLVAAHEYWQQFEKTVVAETTEALNDTYLKANDQEEGTKTYGKVVDLLLAAYKKEHAEKN